MKILIIDTYYPEFMDSLPFDRCSTYEIELQKVLDERFGTFDAYSRALRALGHESVDIIANSWPLQTMWGREHGITEHILRNQIAHHKPDVVFLQDASLRVDPGPYILAAQISCPWPGDKAVSKLDVAFTSFPHYMQRFRALGVRAVYLPLAFDPIVLEGQQPERDIDISFVGGVGRDSHWRSGTDTLEIIAERFQERFHWFGYGIDSLPAASALRACYRGEAWGRQQYDIYRRSKIVVNRHGEVAEGVANNLRCFEATGCGAMLVTEAAPNLSDLFVCTGSPYREVITYSSPEQAVSQIEGALGSPSFGIGGLIAKNGQARTLRDHTYAQRMEIVADSLTEMLCRA